VATPGSELSHAWLRREPLVPSTGLAPLGPAGGLQPPPPPGPAELQHEADRTDRVVREAVLGERHPHRIGVLEPRGTSPNGRGQRTGILEPDELDGGPNGRARQVRIPGEEAIEPINGHLTRLVRSRGAVPPVRHPTDCVTSRARCPPEPEQGRGRTLPVGVSNSEGAIARSGTAFFPPVGCRPFHDMLTSRSVIEGGCDGGSKGSLPAMRPTLRPFAATSTDTSFFRVRTSTTKPGGCGTR
jgi:hypothetical protein